MLILFLSTSCHKIDLNLYWTQKIPLNNQNLCVLAIHLAVRCTVTHQWPPRAFLHPIWQVKAVASASRDKQSWYKVDVCSPMRNEAPLAQPKQQKWGQTCFRDSSLIYKRMSLWDWWSWWSLSAAGGTPRNNDHPQRFLDKSMLTRQRESCAQAMRSQKYYYRWDNVLLHPVY